MASQHVPLAVPQSILESWQGIVDILAEIIGVPAGLIMRVEEQDIEVFVASHTTDNPYRPGEREPVWDSGLYCEAVLRTKRRLLVANALADEDWKDCPDTKLHMIAYLGFPILLPGGAPFGTVCVLDNKENAFSRAYEQLMEHMRDLIQDHLELLYVNQVLGDTNKRMADYLSEIQALRGIVPICAHCKRIRGDDGTWHPVEHYLSGNPETSLSHTYCPECLAIHYPELGKDT